MNSFRCHCKFLMNSKYSILKALQNATCTLLNLNGDRTLHTGQEMFSTILKHIIYSYTAHTLFLFYSRWNTTRVKK